MSSQGTGAAAVDSEIANVHLMLEQWGRWVRSDRVELQANSMFKLGSTVASAMITDDEAVRIDGIVAQLKQRRPDMGKVIHMYYGQGLACDRKVAKATRQSTTRARSSRRAGLAWIDGVLAAGI